MKTTRHEAHYSFGLSGGYKVTAKPDAWTIVNDRLHLNYN